MYFTVPYRRLEFPFLDANSDTTYWRVYTTPDGSCLLHAIASSLNPDQVTAPHINEKQRITKGLELRKQIMNDSELYHQAVEGVEPSLRQYVPRQRELRCSNFFLGEFAWNMIATALNAGIIMILSRGKNRGIVALPFRSKQNIERYKKRKNNCHPEINEVVKYLPKHWVCLAFINNNHFETILQRVGNNTFGIYDINSPIVQYFINV